MPPPTLEALVRHTVTRELGRLNGELAALVERELERQVASLVEVELEAALLLPRVNAETERDGEPPGHVPQDPATRGAG